MTVKEFFKSTALKCIVVLLCVLLVSGIFLTVMNSLLSVSAEEKFERAINKIYGKSVRTETVAVANYNDNATIEEAYKIKDDGNYLIKATGKGGFEGGTVTCWVVVEVKNGNIDGIGKVVIDSNKGQSYIGNITDKFLSGFYVDYENGQQFTPYDASFIKTGATRSATAICNAVNGALDYVNALFGNVTEDIYKDFLFTEYIDTKNTTHEIVDGTVAYKVATKGHEMPAGFNIDITVGADGKITAFTITLNGSSPASYANSMKPEIVNGTLFIGKGIDDIKALCNEGIEFGGMSADLKTGATQSNYLCVCAAAFATANYESLLPTEPDEGDSEDEGGENNE